jgi:hypothetical protein
MVASKCRMLPIGYRCTPVVTNGVSLAPEAAAIGLVMDSPAVKREEI